MADTRNSGNNTPRQAPQGTASRRRPGGPQNSPYAALIALVIVVGCILWAYFGDATSSNTVSLTTSDFVTAMKEGRVESATYKTEDGSLTGSYWTDADDVGDDQKALPYRTYYVGSDSLDELMAAHPKTSFTVDTSSSSLVETLLVTVLPTVLLVLVFVYYMRRMTDQSRNQMQFGTTNAKTTEETRPTTKFSDVAGIDEAVEELQEIKDFLTDPDRYRRMGAHIPRGVLLVGPPGTGKTLLAKAVAGEAGVPFFSISGSDFVEMFVGVGASRVRDLFKQAKEAAPCIIFIDEIDAVGRQRGAGLGGGHDEREQTLNQLLVEMDGFEDNTAVILIAATNRPDILDPALLRPGRFDRRVTVDRPDVGGREKILRVHSKDKPLDSTVDLARMAKVTTGFTGADLANLMNEAALLAARARKDKISMLEVEEAMERVIAGPERKSRVITAKERRTIAYHESGHALVGNVLKDADPIHKISIISRGQALGYTMQMPEEDHFLETRSGMLDQLVVLLGGRTAEELFCDDVTTGASNDLERATKMAREMVTRYGMSEELGTQVFGEAQHEVFLGRDFAQHSDLSEETARRIDAEVARLMARAHARARAILEPRRAQMDTMARVLLERETVEGEEVQALLDNRWDEYEREHPTPAKAQAASDDEILAEAREAAERAMAEAEGTDGDAQASAGAADDAKASADAASPADAHAQAGDDSHDDDPHGTGGTS